jgi:hypothetical protein
MQNKKMFTLDIFELAHLSLSTDINLVTVFKRTSKKTYGNFSDIAYKNSL